MFLSFRAQVKPIPTECLSQGDEVKHIRMKHPVKRKCRYFRLMRNVPHRSRDKRFTAIRNHKSTINIPQSTLLNQKSPKPFGLELSIRRRLPTLPLVCSTIGAVGLNFSVRNGKRCIPGAITTLMGHCIYS